MDLRTTPPRICVQTHVGDLLAQEDVDALVNPWNRNFIPRRLLLAGGVSGQLKKRTGPGPWKELASQGMLPLGSAVLTNGGKLGPHLVHVAGINMIWKATAQSITTSCTNAVRLAWHKGFNSIAMPLIGAGHGRFNPTQVHQLLITALATFDRPSSEQQSPMLVRIIVQPQSLVDY